MTATLEKSMDEFETLLEESFSKKYLSFSVMFAVSIIFEAEA